MLLAHGKVRIATVSVLNKAAHAIELGIISKASKADARKGVRVSASAALSCILVSWRHACRVPAVHWSGPLPLITKLRLQEPCVLPRMLDALQPSIAQRPVMQQITYCPGLMTPCCLQEQGPLSQPQTGPQMAWTSAVRTPLQPLEVLCRCQAHSKQSSCS